MLKLGILLARRNQYVLEVKGGAGNFLLAAGQMSAMRRLGGPDYHFHLMHTLHSNSFICRFLSNFSAMRDKDHFFEDLNFQSRKLCHDHEMTFCRRFNFQTANLYRNRKEGLFLLNKLFKTPPRLC